jgi:hypothetical protein
VIASVLAFRARDSNGEDEREREYLKMAEILMVKLCWFSTDRREEKVRKRFPAFLFVNSLLLFLFDTHAVNIFSKKIKYIIDDG